MWMRGRERKGGEKPNPGKYLPYEICGEFIFVDNAQYVCDGGLSPCTL
jgi:hypothetical protein